MIIANAQKAGDFWCLGKGGKCGHIMSITKGCNHMQCPKCKEFSCYGCGQLWNENNNGKDNYWYGKPGDEEYSLHYHTHNPPRRDYKGDEPFPGFEWAKHDFYPVPERQQKKDWICRICYAINEDNACKVCGLYQVNNSQ